MKTWFRFRDLKARGLVKSRPQLKRLVDRGIFPPGRMIGPNARAWSDEEIEEYENSRPIAGPEPRGIAKVNRDRKAADTATTA
jgi:hypothetical protein